MIGGEEKRKKINVIRSLPCSVTVGDGLRNRRGNGNGKSTFCSSVVKLQGSEILVLQLNYRHKSLRSP